MDDIEIDRMIIWSQGILGNMPGCGMRNPRFKRIEIRGGHRVAVFTHDPQNVSSDFHETESAMDYESLTTRIRNYQDEGIGITEEMRALNALTEDQ